MFQYGLKNYSLCLNMFDNISDSFGFDVLCIYESNSEITL